MRRPTRFRSCESQSSLARLSHWGRSLGSRPVLPGKRLACFAPPAGLSWRGAFRAQKENPMRRTWTLTGLAALAVALAAPAVGGAACCYFSAKNADILQPAQKVFISWDPVKKVETFTVQPKFEGNALDFGMVIPTPSQPKLHEMPRDFFKHLAVYSIMKKREFPHSKLLPVEFFMRNASFALGGKGAGKAGDDN